MFFFIKQICLFVCLPAGTENDLVCPQAGLGANEGNVDEHLGVQQRLESLQYVRLMIVPTQRVVRLKGHPVVGTVRGD